MKMWKKISKLGIIFIIFAAVAVMASCSKTPNNSGNNGTVKTDKNANSGRAAAQDFTLTDINGKESKLSDYRGKVVVLNFFATWCPPCKQELPGFVKTVKEYADNQKLVFLFIDVGEKKDTVLDFINENKDKGYKVLVPLLDVAGEASNKYNVTGIPSTFIIDKEGNLAQSHEGYMEDSLLKQYIDEEL